MLSPARYGNSMALGGQGASGTDEGNGLGRDGGDAVGGAVVVTGL